RSRSKTMRTIYLPFAGTTVPRSRPEERERGPISRSVRGMRRRLDEFDEDSAGVLRMQEVDARIGGAPARSLVQQAHAALTQEVGDRVEVGHPVGELLHTRSVAIEELRDRGVLVQRREQL